MYFLFRLGSGKNMVSSGVTALINDSLLFQGKTERQI
jgi:hypothetical protein